jgi:hypothetical protein
MASLAEFLRLRVLLFSKLYESWSGLQASAMNCTKELALRASERCSGIAVGDLWPGQWIFDPSCGDSRTQTEIRG